MHLGQKWHVWEMCTQPNIVPRPSTSLFAKSFFPGKKRAQKQHELLDYIIYALINYALACVLEHCDTFENCDFF